MNVSVGKFVFDNRSHSATLTIAIPTFERPTELQSAINSLLCQDVELRNVSILVVNNTQDKDQLEITRKIIEQYKHLDFAYFENSENIGMFGNWNQCIYLSKTNFVSILNDDDCLGKSFLRSYNDSTQSIKLFVPRAQIVGDQASHVKVVIKKGWFQLKHYLIGERNYNKMPANLYLRGNTIHASLGVVFHRQCALKISGFCEENYPVADLIFTHEYARRYGVTYNYETLGLYNWGDNASLKPETRSAQAVKEFQMRQLFIKREYKKAAFWTRFITFWSIVHLKSKHRQLSLDMNVNLDLGRYSSLVKKVPLINIRIVYLMWWVIFWGK